MSGILSRVDGPPNVADDAGESLFNSVVIIGGSALGIAYLLRVLPKEKEHLWSTIGWFAMGSLWYGGLRGVSGVLYHFSQNQKKGV